MHPGWGAGRSEDAANDCEIRLLDCLQHPFSQIQMVPKPSWWGTGRGTYAGLTIRFRHPIRGALDLAPVPGVPPLATVQHASGVKILLMLRGVEDLVPLMVMLGVEPDVEHMRDSRSVPAPHPGCVGHFVQSVPGVSPLATIRHASGVKPNPSGVRGTFRPIHSGGSTGFHPWLRSGTPPECECTSGFFKIPGLNRFLAPDAVGSSGQRDP